MKIIVAATEFIVAICRTNLNWFEFVQQIAATKQGQATCRSNSADGATCRSDVSLRFVASCVSAFKKQEKIMYHVSVHGNMSESMREQEMLWEHKMIGESFHSFSEFSQTFTRVSMTR